MRLCACGCNQPMTNPDRRRRFLFNHYSNTPESRLTAAKGGRNGRGAAKRRDQAGRRKQRAA